MAGDQVGYRVGRIGGHGFLDRLAAHPARGPLVTKAVDLMNQRGALGIFFTRWLFAPVGPWANFAAGATGFNYRKFTFWAIAGEVVWVSLYVLLGYSFAGNIEAASQLAGSSLGLLAGVAAMLGFGWWLITANRTTTQP